MARDEPNNIEEDENQGPPGWIVSFSDMVTLLLAFFVLLQSFATIQDEELFYKGMGSFRRAIDGFGIPKWVFGKKDRPRREHAKVQHPTESDPDDPSRRREINPDDDRIRQLFEQLKQDTRNRSEDVEQTEMNASGPSIRFEPGQAELAPDGRRKLAESARTLVETLHRASIDIYVVGQAPDAGGEAEQWALSIARATAAADVVRAVFAEDRSTVKWRVHPLGAGGGNEWCRRRLGLTRDGSHIGMAAVAEGNPDGG